MMSHAPLEPMVLDNEAATSLAELAVRSQVVQCDVQRTVPGTKTSAGGQGTSRVVAGSYLVEVVSLQSLRREAELLTTGGMIQAEGMYNVLFPRGADIRQSDRLLIGSNSLEVMGTDRAKSSRTRLVVLAKEIR